MSAVGLIAICMLSGCGLHQGSIPGQSRATATSEGLVIPPTFDSFLDFVKKTFTAQELKEAADQFFQTHPGFKGDVPKGQWPEVVEIRTRTINMPLHVFAHNRPEGMTKMEIQFTGSSWLGAILIGRVDEGEPTSIRPTSTIQILKWEEGIYLSYFSFDATSQDDPTERARRLSARLEDFLETVKKSFTAKELRQAADQFFQVHPDFDDFVEGRQWPPIFKLKRGSLPRPTFVQVSKDSDGRQCMMVEFAGSFWLQGIWIGPADAVDLQTHPRARTKHLKWEQGIYVYYCP